MVTVLALGFPDTNHPIAVDRLKFPCRSHPCRIESKVTKRVLQVGLNIGQTAVIRCQAMPNKLTVLQFTLVTPF